MNRTISKCASILVVFLFSALILSGTIEAPQEKSDDVLQKKYAPILGEYEFDLTSMGGNVQVLSYYVKDGELWADSGDGDPAIMEPMEGDEFAFNAEGSDGQAFEIRFSKDDQGEYTICKILIVAMGLEVEGSKIK
jgi:hypothetical protein